MLRERLGSTVRNVQERLSFFKSLLDPVRATVNPKKYYSSLRSLLDRYGIYATGIVYFASWVGASILTFILILVLEAFRSIKSLSLTGIFMAPLKALAYSVAFPIIAALIDAILIAIILYFFPRKRPIYDVFAVRASSLLPYGLRVALLELTGRLSFITLISATTSKLGLALLGIGTLLTIYGLRRTMGVNMIGAIIAGGVPFLYKIILGYHIL